MNNSLSSTINNNDLSELALEKIQFGEQLIDSTKKYEKLEGLQKLQRKIKQELLFLRRILKSNTIKKEHLQCSNLTHFSALINTLNELESYNSVNKPFMLNDRKIIVDIVSDNGLTWIKVIARNPKSINQICRGDASFGVRSILDQANEYAECAKLYPCCFQTPKIIFIFANGIGSKLATKIESLGIAVQGNRLKDLSEEELSDSEDESSEEKTFDENISSLSTINAENIMKINLDVSAMLAYISSVTNGSAGLYKLPPGVLAQQAEWERLRPQKPLIDNFIKGKKLYCCQTALDNFVNIVNTVGGENEKLRAEEFMKRLTVLADDATVEDTTEDCDTSNNSFNNVQFSSDKLLNVGGKIKERSLIIFTFGDRIKAVTVTANDGFVRAAKQQGVNFVVFVHESRALTEQKEQARALPFNSDNNL